ncbi:hypothetical protein K443DRAFT_681743 [Laccaria amethystina LaAM-08-1]|uniref:DUF2415 domain-containing protein n=1 Tax=Laccaria amethystina LaAM-08-1 TaxID=1095629 RepID=A0A0C9X752_9AGAR|nr:hypothetical protein K443DRAFT_681743 [Laccaria amethystina LaAM-08-1]
MHEPPSLLKSRIPRKTIIVDHNLFTHDEESRIYDLHCPLRKGTIYYRRDGAIFELNIHSSGKHEPQIIVPKHPSWRLEKISFVPIKGNRVLLFARYFGKATIRSYIPYLYLSIHEIHSNNRVGPALWSFDGSVYGHLNIYHLELIKSTENPSRITWGERFDDHWKLFDISTTETDASNKFPLIESGRMDFDLKLHRNSLVMLCRDRRILLNVDQDQGRQNETIDIHYSDSNNMNFSFVTRMSIPIRRAPGTSPTSVLAFSADGSKFAMATACGRVSVWDIQSKVPLKIFLEVPKSDYDRFVPYLQFSSGNLGKEVLVFVESDGFSSLETIHVIDATSFETEEILLLKREWLEKVGIYIGVQSLFLDPSGGTLYAEINGTLYEWDLQKNKPGPEWWIGE